MSCGNILGSICTQARTELASLICHISERLHAVDPRVASTGGREGASWPEIGRSHDPRRTSQYRRQSAGPRSGAVLSLPPGLYCSMPPTAPTGAPSGIVKNKRTFAQLRDRKARRAALTREGVTCYGNSLNSDASWKSVGLGRTGT